MFLFGVIGGLFLAVDNDGVEDCFLRSTLGDDITLKKSILKGFYIYFSSTGKTIDATPIDRLISYCADSAVYSHPHRPWPSLSKTEKL